MSARDEILARVRAATADVTTSPRVMASSPSASSLGALRNRHQSDDLVGVFAENVADYRAEVVRVRAAEVPGAVAQVLTRLGLGSVVVPTGLDPAWVAALEAGFDVVREDDAGSATELDRIDAVVTAAALGIAATGTVVLDHGSDQGRRELTLVPDTHVCVVREDQVVDDVPDAVRFLGGEAHRGRPLTWVSGPSATSDIELQRVEGVHGPRTLVVVLVTDG
ncbi:LutC/YkgG family protein [Knoellia sp. CPCC 206450]|uniref:LutC/YkgG family protein n=1 Tax=Knoellia tibetensis TaxID=3404798 RepID=UPI003B43CAC4